MAINKPINLAPTTSDSTAFEPSRAVSSRDFKILRRKTSEIEGMTVNLESELSIQAGQIALKVSANEVISAINLTPETITINANRINLQGYVTLTNLETPGQTIINGGNITTGTINASLATITNINASNISTGTLSADRIAAGSISAAKISVTNLSAINTNLGAITGGSLNIGGGTFTVTTGGALTATSATITGVINANSGRIGNATFNSASGGVVFGGNFTVQNIFVNTSTGVLVCGASQSSDRFLVYDGATGYRVYVGILSGVPVLRAVAI